MRIIRIVARGGEFYFNFNISIETIQIFESFRSEREKSRKFRRKFETLPSNTDLNNAHTREKIGTWRSRDSITIKYHDTFIQILRIKSIYLVPYRAVFFFFLFFFWSGTSAHYTFQGIYIDPRPSGIKLCIKRDHFLSTEIGNWNKRSGWEEEAWLRLISASLSTRCFENK